MKKPSRSKKSITRKAPQAPSVIARAAGHAYAPAIAGDIGPLTAFLLLLPPPVAKPSPARNRSSGPVAAPARLPDDASAFLLLSLPIAAMILSLIATQSLKPLRRAELAATPAASTIASRTPVATVTRTPPLPPLTALAPPAAATPPAPAAIIARNIPNGIAILPSQAIPPLGQSLPGLSTPESPIRTGLLETLRSSLSVPPGAVTAPAIAKPALPELASREAPLPSDPAVCTAPAHVLARSRPAIHRDPAVATLTPAAFGQALAAAAQSQTSDFVIYNDKYRAIAYPGGDVQPLYGVCTDVVIRAYRALGIDLQPLVHEARLGSGDTSIDHRRTEVLRRFFARFGEQLAITTFAEDYLPGDIVTYNRPQNRHSRAHIAMVSNVPGPSGRYMIVHNRGWGPQLEDGLFVDEITGHYRYRTAPQSPAAIASTGSPERAASAPAPQKRPAAMSRISAREARVAALRRRDGATVPGLGR